MNDLNINPDLQDQLKELDYFFNVLNRAAVKKKDNASTSNWSVSENEVRAVLTEDLNSYTKLSPKLDNLVVENKERFEEAKKQIELNIELTPLLNLIAGVTSNRMSQISAPGQQMGQNRNNAQNTLLTHPALAPFLDQAASSFLDAYKQIQDEKDNINQNEQDNKAPENKNKNQLTLQYKHAMKNKPEFKQRLEAALQYTPTIKLTRT